MYYENLPIFRSAMNLAVYIESVVKSFERYCVLAVGTLLEFFDKKIKAVSLYSQTPSLLDINNRCRHTTKPINLKIGSNFFSVFGLPTGCFASEGNSFNFAEQNSSNVPAVRTQEQFNIQCAGVIHESNPFDFDRS